MQRWFREYLPPPPLPPDTYDMIIVIDLHGKTSLTMGDIKTCELLPMTEGKQATFLEATPCGVCNLSYVGYWTNMVKMMIENLKDERPTKVFTETCQSVFRILKKTKFDKIDFTHVASEEEQADFKRNEGWDIVECKTKYVNKQYQEDPDPLKEHAVFILYSEHPEIPVGTILNQVHSRVSLLKYIFDQGVTHPLIIDVSCSSIDAGSPTANRHAARTEKKRRTGGRKLTKRPKVKKLIHFA